MVFKKSFTLLVATGITLFLALFFSFPIWLDVPHLTNEHRTQTASLAEEVNSEYCQSSGAHNIKHI